MRNTNEVKLTIKQILKLQKNMNKSSTLEELIFDIVDNALGWEIAKELNISATTLHRLRQNRCTSIPANCLIALVELVVKNIYGE